MKPLSHRLALAVLLPIVLVTAVMGPMIWSNLQNRLEGSRARAESLLDAEYDVLIQGIHQSLNHSLAIAEFPSVVQHLNGEGETRSPYQEQFALRNREQLADMFNTLLTHFGRYTRLALIDTNGGESLSARELASPVRHQRHSEAMYFRQAMKLSERSLFISPPHLGPAAAGPEITTMVMDIATPVFGRDGRRLGVLLMTLDWHYLVNRLPHAVGTHPDAQALLVDASGTSLLPSVSSAVPFGGSIPQIWPDIWQAMNSSDQGGVFIGDDLMVFRTSDVRTHHRYSQSGQVSGLPGTHPWRVAILIPRPGLTDLLRESPWVTVLVALFYGLAVVFSIVWVLINHHQRRLKEKAQQLSRQARESARQLNDLYQNAPCGYHSLNEDGVIAKINRTELRWLGYSAEELIGKQAYRELVTPKTRDAFDKAFREVLGEEHEVSAECELMCRDGSSFPVAIKATAQKTSEGFQYSRAMVFDITEVRKLQELLISQAMTDPLTGLGNRRYLENQAAIEMARARRSGESMCLVAIDLDRFKMINDTYGHDVGDLVLQAFAQTAQVQLREGDLLCRIGGEEFTILLPHTRIEQAVPIAERLRESIESTPVDVAADTLANKKLFYTVSIGVTAIDIKEISLQPAIKRADALLYKAKEAGRNRTFVK